MLLPLCRRHLVAKTSPYQVTHTATRCFSDIMTNLGVPHIKTRVLLQNLPATATEQSIRDAVADLNCRRVEIEPGCAVYFTSEVAAIHAKAAIVKLGCEANLKPATLPSIVLNNLNPSVTVEELASNYGKFDPKLIRLLSSAGIQVAVDNTTDALKVQKAVEAMNVGGNQLKAYCMTLPDNKMAVQVYNIPSTTPLREVAAAVESTAKGMSGSAVVSVTKAAAQSVKLRFPGSTSTAVMGDIMSKLANCEVQGKKGSVTSTTATPYRIPALFLRNVNCMTKSDIENELLSNASYDRLQMIMKSKDVAANLAVVYFKSESDAVKTFYELRNKPKRNANGEKIEVSLKFTAEPAIRVSNLPSTVDSATIATYFQRYSVSRIEPGNIDGEMVVIFATPRLAQLAVEGMNKKVIEGAVITCTNHAFYDHGVEVQFNDALTSTSRDEIMAEIASKYELPVPIKSITTDSNVSAVVGFSSTEATAEAAKHFNSSNAATSTTRSKLMAHPAYVLEVTNYPADKSVEALTAAINTASPVDNSILRVNRNAIVKFKRNQDVVPGIKKLETLPYMQSNDIRVSRYSPVTPAPTSSYDTPNDMDTFDSLMGRELNTEYLYTNPALRYQVVKNSFERRLYDARIRDDATLLINPAVTTLQLKHEVQSLLKASRDDAASEKRLFEIYLQQEDLKKLTKGFDEMSLLFGDANGLTQSHNSKSTTASNNSNNSSSNAIDGNDEFSPEHPLHWSKFADVNVPRDFQRIQDQLRALDKEALANPEVALGLKPAGKDSLFHKEHAKAVAAGNDDNGDETDETATAVASTNGDADADADDNEHLLAITRFGHKKDALTISDEEEDEDNTTPRRGSKEYNEQKEYIIHDDNGVANTISMDDPQQLKDKTGFAWSGIVLDNDTTQKTMPGGRVMTHRCLVVVGNLRGTAGFGKGKGKNAEDALHAAFRDALRNLLHVDLYDNYGLCHDVHGKHNACHSYIRHTSRERMMIASPFASEIFVRFGISSVSCKMVGRRDPYAQVRAIFNALSKHMNIDEIAKLRGKRYFTLKHALENKV